MKLFTSIIVATLGVAWALPTQQEDPALPAQQEDPALPAQQDEQDAPVETTALLACAGLLYNAAYCCSEGALGLYTDCETPVIPPLTVIDFKLQCGLAGKDAYCCLRPLIGTVPLICSVP